MDRTDHMNRPPSHKKSVLLALVVVTFLVVLLFLLNRCSHKATLTPVRIGWQVAWATQGQIAQVLKHTNILAMNGLEGQFYGFTYGAPLNEAALAGNIDVGFVADQLATSLIARGGKFKIVARLIYFRAGIIVPPESDIKTVEDLKGKTIAIPFGSTTHRIVLGMLQDAGLDPSKDLKIINMDITDQSGVVLAGTATQWKGGVDALASWDPNIAIFVSKGDARVLKSGVGLGVVYMSDDFIEKHRGAAISFLKAYIEAYYYYITHQAQANDWFAKEARIEFDPSLLNVAASFEPNMKAHTLSQIDVGIHPQDIKTMEDGAKFAFTLRLTATKPDMAAVVDTTLLSEAEKQVSRSNFGSSKVEVQ